MRKPNTRVDDILRHGYHISPSVAHELAASLDAKRPASRQFVKQTANGSMRITFCQPATSENDDPYYRRPKRSMRMRGAL